MSEEFLIKRKLTQKIVEKSELPFWLKKGFKVMGNISELKIKRVVYSPEKHD